MNILITGVNGFIGKALYKHLSAGHRVYGIYMGECDLENTFRFNLMNVGDIAGFMADNADIAIDVIIHLASKMANAQNLNEVSIVADNLQITKNVCGLAKYFRVSSFINFSSSSVYPNIDGCYDETSLPDPSKNSDCLYGLSKLNSEIVINYELGAVVPCITHLRVAMVHGEGMDQTRITPVLKRELVESNSLTVFGNGKRLINQIHLNTLIKYVSFFVDNPVNDTINISEECLSLSELAARIKTDFGNHDTEIKLVNKGNTYKFRLSNSKLLNIVNRMS